MGGWTREGSEREKRRGGAGEGARIDLQEALRGIQSAMIVYSPMNEEDS